MKALIIVDVQNDFCPGGALPVPDGHSVVPIINRLQPLFDLVVATQDWHPGDHRSFAGNHGQAVGTVVDLEGLPQVLWPDHCVQHSRGAAFVDSLLTGSIAKVFRKGMDKNIDSYSGFFDNGHKAATGLATYLTAQHVTEVYVVGLATDYCVAYTALDSVSLGFSTVVVEDATRGVNLHPGDASQALQKLKQAGVLVCQSADVLKGISR